jgi:hypothetical protein
MTVIVQILSVLGVINFDWQIINDLSLAASLGLIVIAYILGGAFDNLAVTLFQLLKKQNISGRTLERFKKAYQDRWQIDFQDDDWPLLLAFVRTKSLDLAGELDRHSALSIMLRNVSLGLLLMAVNSLIQFLISRNPIDMLISIFMFVLSLLILREAIKFRSLFYESIYQTILAYRMDLETAIKPTRSGGRRSNVTKG